MKSQLWFAVARMLTLVALVGLAGCFANNQDWTKKPATKTDYIPGQLYQLQTNLYFSTRNVPDVLYLHVGAGADGLLDTGTRLRVTTVHYNGDSFEMGFYTTVRAEVATGPFKGRNFDISHLSRGPHSFIARNPNVLIPVDEFDPDLNTNHFAWAVERIVEYGGEYSWDWWKRGNEEPTTIMPIRFLVGQKQNDLLFEACSKASSAEGKAYALSALRGLNDERSSELARKLGSAYPTIRTYHNGLHGIESTATVLARMQQDTTILFPSR